MKRDDAYIKELLKEAKMSTDIYFAKIASNTAMLIAKADKMLNDR